MRGRQSKRDLFLCSSLHFSQKRVVCCCCCCCIAVKELLLVATAIRNKYLGASKKLEAEHRDSCRPEERVHNILDVVPFLRTVFRWRTKKLQDTVATERFVSSCVQPRRDLFPITFFGGFASGRQRKYRLRVLYVRPSKTKSTKKRKHSIPTKQITNYTTIDQYYLTECHPHTHRRARGWYVLSLVHLVVCLVGTINFCRDDSYLFPD